MVRLLIVEKGAIVRAVFQRLLSQDISFSFDITNTYEEAKTLLSKKKYDFAVADRILPDAKDGQIISLLNKHGISPLIYTKSIDEEFIESFESANIIDYILRHRHDNVQYVVDKLKQLQINKKISILIAHASSTYIGYLKNNLSMHNFNVITVHNGYEAISKIKEHRDIRLLIVDEKLSNINGLEKMNGFQLVRKIKDTKLNNKLKILSLSSESSSSVTSFFLNEGADDYLIVPFSRDELYKRIYANIKRSRLTTY